MSAGEGGKGGPDAEGGRGGGLVIMALERPLSKLPDKTLTLVTGGPEEQRGRARGFPVAMSMRARVGAEGLAAISG